MTVADQPQITEDEAFDRLANDWPLYAEKVCKIANKAGRIVPFEPRPGQLKLWAALEKQRAAGQPMRVRILKARQIGFSTLAQSLLLQRATTRQNHHSYTVAQDRKTGGELFAMTDLMYSHLPEGTPLKPPLANRRRKQELKFGERAGAARQTGRVGLNSWYQVDTATETSGGSGFTIHSMHLSELSKWQVSSIEDKLLGLLQTVPDEPDTLVIQEATAKGYNYWHKLWIADDDYAKVFVAWWEEPTYQKAFQTSEDRDEFVESIGTNEDYGEYEQDAYERWELTPEQLHWWRWALRNKADGDLRKMQQEYPASPEEAFMATGAKVFDPNRVHRLINDTQTALEAAPPETGVLRPGRTHTRKTLNGTIEVPSEPLWTPRGDAKLGMNDPFWEVWEHPVQPSDDGPPGAYVIGCDPASEEESESGESAWHAIEVVNHRTDQQAAEIRAKGLDAFELASLLVLAGRYWNNAWVAVEITGGWGVPAVRILHREFKYQFVYTRKSLERGKEHFEDRLGWDSNKVSKRFLIEDTKQDLRDEATGIRSAGLARELSTLVKDKRGMAAPESGEFADRFMAWAIAKRVAQEKPVKPWRKRAGAVSTAVRRVRSEKMGY